MVMKPGYFSFNGLDSEEHHIFIQDRPDIVAPKRRVSFIAPNAFEGELAYDDDGYEQPNSSLSVSTMVANIKIIILHYQTLVTISIHSLIKVLENG